MELQTRGPIAGALTTLVLYGLPDDYHARLRQQLLDRDGRGGGLGGGGPAPAPGGLTLVIEGDAAAIRDELADTGLGELIDSGELSVRMCGGRGRR